MIARCDTCGRSFLEIDSRRQVLPARCAGCELDSITTGEAVRIAAAGRALQVLAAVPAAWVTCRRRLQR